MSYRPELPNDVPTRIKRLPIHRGYPVPWFVVWLDDSGNEVPAGEGTPDFRITKPGATAIAHNGKRCWICGEPLGKYVTFVSGPMCGVNRTSAEPPAHLDCGDWAARACPFLVRPHAKRRDIKLDVPEAPGVMLKRNPGVAMVWTTKSYKPFRVPNGVLFRMGDPEHVRWYREGRPANYTEVLESVTTGLPPLVAVAKAEPGGMAQLQQHLERFLPLLPVHPVRYEDPDGVAERL